MNLDYLYEQAVAYGGRIILSLVALLIGLAVIKHFMKFVEKGFEKNNLDLSLRPFLMSLIKITLKIVLIISVASMMGAQMTSFIAILGSAGLAIGLALQGSLSNFAGGVLILLLKPFTVGDYIEAAGYSEVLQQLNIHASLNLSQMNWFGLFLFYFLFIFLC
jgi:small conductance mechanosensitive channel